MSSFKFNFFNTVDTVDDQKKASNLTDNEKENKSSNLNANNSKEHFPVLLDDSAEWLCVTISSTPIENTSTKSTATESGPTENTSTQTELNYLKNATFGGIAALISTTDLIPHVYEGGFQVWECTLDLMSYIVNNPQSERECVLDLGCGAGLLGILAGTTSAGSCHFQDFNADVIENFTMPNYMKNCERRECDKFYSGDWDVVSSRLGSYDLILSSETIYCRESQGKILRILQRCLKQGGVALIASKRHYFGVGGGVLDFVELVNKSSVGLVCDVVWTSESGLPRDIIQITHSV